MSYVTNQYGQRVWQDDFAQQADAGFQGLMASNVAVINQVEAQDAAEEAKKQAEKAAKEAKERADAAKKKTEENAKKADDNSGAAAAQAAQKSAEEAQQRLKQQQEEAARKAAEASQEARRAAEEAQKEQADEAAKQAAKEAQQRAEQAIKEAQRLAEASVPDPEKAQPQAATQPGVAVPQPGGLEVPTYNPNSTAPAGEAQAPAPTYTTPESRTAPTVGAGASDGQTLAQQTQWTRDAFTQRYGNNAETEWVREHERELERNRSVYGASEPKAGTAPITGAPTGTPAAPNRTIGAVEPPKYTGPQSAAASPLFSNPDGTPVYAPKPGQAPGVAGPGTVPSENAGTLPPTDPSGRPRSVQVAPPIASTPAAPGPIKQPGTAPTALPAGPPQQQVADTYVHPAGAGPNPGSYTPIPVPGGVPQGRIILYDPDTKMAFEGEGAQWAEYERKGYKFVGVSDPTEPTTPGGEVIVVRGGYPGQQQQTIRTEEWPTAKQDGWVPIGRPFKPQPPGYTQTAAVPPVSPAIPAVPQAPASPPVAPPVYPSGPDNSNVQLTPSTSTYNKPDEPPTSVSAPPVSPVSTQQLSQQEAAPVQYTNPTPAPVIPQVAAATQTPVQQGANDPVIQAAYDPKPVSAIVRLASKTPLTPEQEQVQTGNVVSAIGAMLQGRQEGTWAEPYLNDVARMAWAREERNAGRSSDPRNAPIQYIEKWKDAFYGSDTNVPLVRELDQQMIDYGASRSASNGPFNWKAAFGADGSKGLISRQIASNDCGPNAFSVVMRSQGYNIDPAQSFTVAKRGGYHNGNEFNGPAAMVRMFNQEAGIPASQHGMDWNVINQELDAGRPVLLSSSKHWYALTARDQQGRYYGGATNAVVGVSEWATPGEFIYGGSRPDTMIITRGTASPDSKIVKELGLKPPTGSGGDARMMLSQKTMAEQQPAPQTQPLNPQQPQTRTQLMSNNESLPSVPNLKPQFTVEETQNMRQRIMTEMPDIQFDPNDSVEVRMQKMAPALDWLEREYGMNAEVMAGMAYNESRLGTAANAPAGKANNLWSVQYLPTDQQSTGPIPQGRWAAYPSVKAAIARFVGMYAHPENGYKNTWQSRSNPDSLMEGLVRDKYIVDEPGFPISNWRAGVNEGRNLYRQVKQQQQPTQSPYPIAEAPVQIPAYQYQAHRAAALI